ESVFLTSLVARALLFAAAGVFAFLFSYVNLRWASRHASLPAVFVSRSGAQIDVSSFVPKLVLIGALVVGFFAAVAASSQWMAVLMALHGVRVGDVDPVLGRDIGFFLFQLPAVSGVLSMVIVLTVLALAGVSVLYLMRGDIARASRTVSVEASAA